MNSRNLKFILVGVFTLIMLTCITFYKFKSDARAKRFYNQGVEFYNNEKYSDAYYNFHQIKPFSCLYKLALLKEFQCAMKLSDKKTAILKLNILIKLVKEDSIRPYILYNEALLSQDTNKDSKALSYKKFKQIASLYPKSDYGIASSYRAAKLIQEKDKKIAKELYVKYLKNAPDGKFAQLALEEINNLNVFMTSDDYEIIGNAFLVNNEYSQALESYKKTSKGRNWYNISKCYKGLGKREFEKNTILEGLKLEKSEIGEQDISLAIKRLIALSKSNKVQALQDLYSDSKDSYIFPTVTYLLAENSTSIRSIKLYEYIAEYFPESIWASNSVWEVFWYNYSQKRYKVCEKYATAHLEKYSEFKDAPRVAYWYGRLLLHEKRNKEARDMFYKVIKEYPLSYYSFLSARQLKMSKAKKMIVKKSIVDYDISNINKRIFDDKITLALANSNDVETIEDLKINNEYVKSWIAFNKENYPVAINLIKNKINNQNTSEDEDNDENNEEGENTKINFSDAELKLMYPVLYSDLINKYAKEFKQSPYLFLSLVREESHFNKNAKSSVGALGLAQIMKPTANFIEKTTVPTETLLNKEENIRIGLKYFKYLVDYFKGDESLAILSYNAGPGNIEKWLKNKNINNDDIDTFVENVPFIETKNYIKKILSSYWVYLNIYSSKNK